MLAELLSLLAGAVGLSPSFGQLPPELLHLSLGSLIQVLSQPVPGLLPTAIGLEIDIEGFDKRKQKRLPREPIATQHLVQGGASQSDPPEGSAGQQPMRIVRAG